MHGRAGTQPKTIVLPWSAELLELVRCPRCRGEIKESEALRCDACEISFPMVGGQPALISFRDSIFSEADIVRPRPAEKRFETSAAGRIRRALVGDNEAARRVASQFIAELKKLSARPRILVIGGATVGNGAEELYAAPGLEIVGTDLYASPCTTLLADGHQLPFADGAFDGVWIQAVLEHVLKPQRVVDEIVRVLRPGGLVYADTPFMYPVHMGAYDFTRFTLSGHRWLFRRFAMLDAGTSAGAGSAAINQIGWFAKSLLGSKIGNAASLAFFWLRFLEPQSRQNADAASGVYFFGRKAERSIGPKDMIEFYEMQQTLLRRRPELSVEIAARALTALGRVWRLVPRRST